MFSFTQDHFKETLLKIESNVSKNLYSIIQRIEEKKWVHQLDKIILKQNQLYLFSMFILLSGDYIEYLELFAIYRNYFVIKANKR